MNIKSYFTPQALFQINAAAISPQEKLIFFAGLILVLLSIVLKIASVLSPSPVDKKFREKFYHLFLTIGLFELFWYLCRWQTVTFFDSHFVEALFFLIGIVWFIVLLIKMLRHYGREKVVWEQEQVKLRYLPNK